MSHTKDLQAPTHTLANATSIVEKTKGYLKKKTLTSEAGWNAMQKEIAEFWKEHDIAVPDENTSLAQRKGVKLSAALTDFIVPTTLGQIKHVCGRGKSTSFSCVWQLGCWVGIILLEHGCAADAVPLYQCTGTHFTNLGRMTG